jgi:hypothetical protein
MCVYSEFVLGSGLATGWSPVRGVLPTVYGLRNWKRGQGPTVGCKAMDRWIDRYADWLTDRPTDWLTGWLTDQLADWLTGWLTDRMTDRPGHRLPAGWLTDWLTDRQTDRRDCSTMQFFWRTPTFRRNLTPTVGLKNGCGYRGKLQRRGVRKGTQLESMRRKRLETALLRDTDIYRYRLRRLSTFCVTSKCN